MTKNFIEKLKEHEGLKLKVYRCPAGKLTIGYGTNLEAGISKRAAGFLLEDKLLDITKQLAEKLPWIHDLTTARREALYDMAYNLGVSGLLKWKNTLKAMEDGRYEDASNLILSSLWHSQVGRRAEYVANLILKGEYENGS